MKVIKCDICGKEIEPKREYALIHSEYNVVYGRIEESWDLCEDCWKKVSDYMDNGCKDLQQQDAYEKETDDLRGQIEHLKCHLEDYERHWVAHVTGDPWYEGPDAEPQPDTPTSTEKPRRAACKRSHGASQED